MRKVYLIGFFISMIGLIGFFSGFVVTVTRNASIWKHTEFHLGDPDAIAVDHKNRVYCALGFYNRIQVYDADGKFLAGWPYPGHQPIRLRINDRNQLEVADPMKLKRGDEPDVLFTFNEGGALVNEQVVDGIYDHFGDMSESMAISSSGNHYVLRDRWLFHT